MVVNDCIKLQFFKTGLVGRLGIQHNQLGIIIHRQGMQTFDGNLQPFDHRYIIQTPNLIGIPDGDAAHSITEKPFHRHSAGKRVWVRCNNDKNFIVLFKKLVKTIQTVQCGIAAGTASHNFCYLFQSFLLQVRTCKKIAVLKNAVSLAAPEYRHSALTRASKKN